MKTIAWIITIAAMLLMPLVSFSYLFLRLAARKELLKTLFGLPGIVETYLASRGESVKAEPGETDDDCRKRLKEEFQVIFDEELSREYGRSRYIPAIIVGSCFSALVIYCLARGSSGSFLLGTPGVLLSPIDFALLGAFAWSMWLILRGYETLDLAPSTFYWIPFRYVVAVIFGLLSAYLLKESFAIVFALISPTIPLPKLFNYLRIKFLKQKQSHVGGPSLWKIQGMEQTTVDRLEGLGINTTQELAYYDPLILLFQTNFSAKVVIDWIDQAILYNYVGERINPLRVRGIRGSIEFSRAKGNRPVIKKIGEDVLKISPDEVAFFIERLCADYQVQLIEKIWDVFKEKERKRNRAGLLSLLARSTKRSATSQTMRGV